MADVKAVVGELKRLGTRANLEGMARYGLPSKGAFGVSMAAMLKLAKRLGSDHALALGLWKHGGYEPRMLATLVDDPALVTPAQMEAWCKDFDNWGIVDTACFKLFDRTPHAWKKVPAWAKKSGEFQRRAGFVLLACLAGHDKTATDAQFLACLPLIEKFASDERNFVKKGVGWALRSYARRGPKLKAAGLAVARRLAASDDPAERWVGKDGLRDLS